MDALARYYTDNLISNLLVQEIKYSNPKIIVDLGIGSGALTNAAFRKWKNASYFATDIDTAQIKSTAEQYPFVKIIEVDSLNKNIEKKLNIKVGTVDVAICNPPYLRINPKEFRFSNLFKLVGLPNHLKLKYLTSDMVFLAQNLLLLRDGGELGIILPDGLLSSREFLSFREDLVKNHTILSVIQLPDRIFRGTEARTHILIIRKGKNTAKQKVKIFLANKFGQIVDYLFTEDISLIERMDFFYHKLNIRDKNLVGNKKALTDIGVEIRRGQLTHAILKENYQNYIHTTTLRHKSELYLTDNVKATHENCLLTSPRDILLARVGRGCIGKVSLVNIGRQLISDCVFCIKVPEQHVDLVWSSICSSDGQLWLKSNSRGVCARTINKSDLLNFPLISD